MTYLKWTTKVSRRFWCFKFWRRAYGMMSKFVAFPQDFNDSRGCAKVDITIILRKSDSMSTGGWGGKDGSSSFWVDVAEYSIGENVFILIKVDFVGEVIWCDNDIGAEWLGIFTIAFPRFIRPAGNSKSLKSLPVLIVRSLGEVAEPLGKKLVVMREILLKHFIQGKPSIWQVCSHSICTWGEREISMFIRKKIK